MILLYFTAIQLCVYELYKIALWSWIPFWANLNFPNSNIHLDRYEIKYVISLQSIETFIDQVAEELGDNLKF